MLTDDGKLDQIDQALKKSQAQSAQLNRQTVAPERELGPPKSVADHTNEGGVV
jgi:hypothetical protein